jgi:diketogulonate reductase-like aldo/keto reductase
MANQPQLTALEITVANIIDDVALQPECVKVVLAKLRELRPIANQIEQSIQQSQQSLKQLYDNQNKVAGSFETLMQLIEDTMPKETIEAHGKELKVQVPK